jgi:alpha-tubulin suppressor-like RCC1 family protein
VVAVAAGESRSLAVKSDGTVWEWTGQPAADLSGVAPQAPRQVSELTDVVALSAAVEFWWGELLDARSLALKRDGTVWVWDEGEGVKSWAPVQVSELTDIVAIAGSPAHNLALKRDGTVWEWWYDDWSRQSTPVQVSELGGVLAVAAGAAPGAVFSMDAYGLALKSDGTVWSWGDNKYGQLGDGTTAYAASPVQVGGISEVATIAAAGVYTSSSGIRPVSVAIKRDGTVWAWGETWNGPLGDGTTCDESKPLPASWFR